MALMNRSSLASRRRLERGQFSWVTLLLLTSLIGGVYLAVVWAPVYIVHQEVKGAVREFINRAVKDRNDELIVEGLCARLRSIDETEGVDARGELVKVPTVDLSPRDITWERDTSSKPPMLHVSFEYVRVVKYPFINRTEEKVMSVDYTKDIAIPKW
jgi:hypothetical protein